MRQADTVRNSLSEDVSQEVSHTLVHFTKLTLCVLKVVTPQRSNFVLTADIPHSKTYTLVLHCFHVKTYDTDPFHKMSDLKGKSRS